MAFGGVATGNINAQLAARATAAVTSIGLKSDCMAMAATTGKKVAVVAMLDVNSVKKIIIFTSDKVYENLKGKVLTEKSHLGGIDPYSASKSCQDIISNSYKSSFFNKKINITILKVLI